MNTQEPNFWQRTRVTLKGILVGILILVLLIPTAFIHELISERKSRQAEVAAEVSSKWAGSQTVTGPFVIIPYTAEIKDDGGKVSVVRHLAYFLPELLQIDGSIIPEIRNRSIYKVVLYKTALQVKGNFSIERFSDLGISAGNFLFSEAQLCFGLTDNRGIDDQLMINWDGTEKSFNAGVPKNALVPSGVSVPIDLSAIKATSSISFNIQLKLKGSEYLFFTPVGKQTQVKLTSSWANPSFDGRFLPADKVINEKGFTANWKILHFNREFPQSWADTEVNIGTSSFGLNLLQPNDAYGKSLRAVKYAILFISLTFCLYFFLELFQKRSVHPMQYILVGLALCIFYTLLLSVSEYIDFNISYMIAATGTVLLITFYTKSLFLEWRIAIWFGLFLTLLYTFIFVLIQLQDGALLFGSIGLFILLAVIMYYSRRIDWNYTKHTTPEPAQAL
jgi:inner membrane protein